MRLCVWRWLANEREGRRWDVYIREKYDNQCICTIMYTVHTHERKEEMNAIVASLLNPLLQLPLLRFISLHSDNHAGPMNRRILKLTVILRFILLIFSFHSVFLWLSLLLLVVVPFYATRRSLRHTIWGYSFIVRLMNLKNCIISWETQREEDTKWMSMSVKNSLTSRLKRSRACKHKNQRCWEKTIIIIINNNISLMQTFDSLKIWEHLSKKGWDIGNHFDNDHAMIAISKSTLRWWEPVVAQRPCSFGFTVNYMCICKSPGPWRLPFFHLQGIWEDLRSAINYSMIHKFNIYLRKLIKRFSSSNRAQNIQLYFQLNVYIAQVLLTRITRYHCNE